jgi:hypothetical protein
MLSDLWCRQQAGRQQLSVHGRGEAAGGKQLGGDAQARGCPRLLLPITYQRAGRHPSLVLSTPLHGLLMGSAWMWNLETTWLVPAGMPVDWLCLTTPACLAHPPLHCSRLERLDRRFLSPLFLTPGSEPASQHRIQPAGETDAAHGVAAPQDAGPAGSSGGGGGSQQGGGAGGEGAHDASSGCAGGMALP